MSILWTVLIAVVATLVAALPLFWTLETFLAKALIHVEPFYTARILLWLAKYDYWWNLITFTPPEGEMFIVVSGNAHGSYFKTLESVDDLEYNRDTHEFEELAAGDVRRNKRKTALQQIGAEWKGANKYLLRQTVEYDKYVSLPKPAGQVLAEGEDEMGLVHKVRPGPNIYSQYLMAVRVHQAETKGNIPVDAVITFTVRIWIPRRAFFFAGGWVARVTADILGTIKTYVGTQDIDDLRSDGVHHITSEMVDMILALNEDVARPNGSIRKGLKNDVGIEIMQATFVKFDLNKYDKAYLASQAAAIADMEGAAAIIKATKDGEAAIEASKKAAEKLAIDTKAGNLATLAIAGTEKDANVLRAVGIKAIFEARSGPNGAALAMADAVGKGEVHTLGIPLVTTGG